MDLESQSSKGVQSIWPVLMSLDFYRDNCPCLPPSPLTVKVDRHKKHLSQCLAESALRLKFESV